METALAIAAVTAVLRYVIEEGMARNRVGALIDRAIVVTSVPPDRVASMGSDPVQVNLFLHRVGVNAEVRNRPGRQTAPLPLALDLHYWVTACSAEEFVGEILLGYAMQVLHDTPLLDHQTIVRALDPNRSGGTSVPQAFGALAGCGLAEQIEPVRILPEWLTTEDLSLVWNSLRAPYRPTAAYLASMVTISSPAPQT
jgi:hypothetical protein